MARPEHLRLIASSAYLDKILITLPNTGDRLGRNGIQYRYTDVAKRHGFTAD